MMNNEIPGFVQGQPGWKLERPTFLGAKGSGAFASLSEAVVWARLLGGQCGGIVHNPQYGYMLTHGHLFVEKSGEGEIAWTSWSKGADHLPEPAYPHSKTGFSRFFREVREQEANGREFTEDFYERYLQDDWRPLGRRQMLLPDPPLPVERQWRKIGRKDFRKDIESIYADAAKPGWREWAWRAGAKAIGAIGTGISVLGRITNKVDPLDVDVEDDQFVVVERDGTESPDLVDPVGIEEAVDEEFLEVPDTQDPDLEAEVASTHPDDDDDDNDGEVLVVGTREPNTPEGRLIPNLLEEITSDRRPASAPVCSREGWPPLTGPRDASREGSVSAPPADMSREDCRWPMAWEADPSFSQAVAGLTEAPADPEAHPSEKWTYKGKDYIVDPLTHKVYDEDLPEASRSESGVRIGDRLYQKWTWVTSRKELSFYVDSVELAADSEFRGGRLYSLKTLIPVGRRHQDMRYKSHWRVDADTGMELI